MKTLWELSQEEKKTSLLIWVSWTSGYHNIFIILEIGIVRTAFI